MMPGASPLCVNLEICITFPILLINRNDVGQYLVWKIYLNHIINIRSKLLLLMPPKYSVAMNNT
jgi:hypothetical protein